MKKLIIGTGLLIYIVFGLSACTPPLLPGPEFTQYVPKDPNKAILYIYRPYGEEYGWKRRYVVMNSDTKEKLIIKHGGYYPIEVNPGRILIVADRSQRLELDKADQNMVIDMEKGKSYYVRLGITMNTWSFSIHLVNSGESVGRQELKLTRLQTSADLVRSQNRNQNFDEEF